MPEWQWYIKREKFDLSLGSRIHGNIMSILAGVPAVVWAIDSRVKEMAEIYNIPIVDMKEKYDIETIYNNTDYERFNAKFAGLFDQYEDFLKKCGLVEKINQKNIFWNRKLPINNEVIEERRENLLHILDDATWIRKIYFEFAERCPNLIKPLGIEAVELVEKY